MSKEFSNALQSENISSIRRIPKSDLHNHAVLGGRISLLEERLGRRIERPPRRMNGIKGVDEYLGKDLRPIYS